MTGRTCGARRGRGHARRQQRFAHRQADREAACGPTKAGDEQLCDALPQAALFKPLDKKGRSGCNPVE
jgi:hypothetical protein